MKYVALFRGINVGGKNVVKMDDLKRLLIDLGLREVRTYIQSGNAVFETPLDEPRLRNAIRMGFSQRFGFESDAIVRSADELDELIDRFPISAEEIAGAQAADPDVEHLYVYFLNDPPEQAQIDAILEGHGDPDILRAGARELYLLCHQSVRKSKLAMRVAKAFDSATVRNWNTVNKLRGLCSVSGSANEAATR